MAKLFDFKIDVKLPPLDLSIPGIRFWNEAGLQAVKEIRIRTETKGEDSEGNRFRPYSPKYRAFRVESGRSGTPNLSFSGRMLGSMARGIRAEKDNVKVQMSGEEGGKAFTNEQRGREFFNLSESQVDKLAQAYLDGIKI